MWCLAQWLGNFGISLKPQAYQELLKMMVASSKHSVRLSDETSGEKTRKSDNLPDDQLSPAARAHLRGKRQESIALIRAVCAGTHAHEELEYMLAWMGDMERMLADLNLPALGMEMNMPPGSNVAANVLPCIKALKSMVSQYPMKETLECAHGRTTSQGPGKPPYCLDFMKEL